jgi:hypothetical protein
MNANSFIQILPWPGEAQILQTTMICI